MLTHTIKEALTFDDVLLLPAKSEVLPKDVNLGTNLAKSLHLGVPFLSAAMDTVTDSRMAIAIARHGGIGIIHKNMSIEEQVRHVIKVKKSESAVVSDPISIGPDEPLSAAVKLKEDNGISGFPVVKGRKLVGILTNRDIRSESDLSTPISRVMTPFAKLVTILEKEPVEKAAKLLHRHRIEKLPVIDKKGELVGLITIRDINRSQSYPNSATDSQKHLLVGAACGVGDKEIERALALIGAGVDLIVVDTAHGHSKGVLATIRSIRKRAAGAVIVGGNVATANGAMALIESGANVVKVGVGPGSICTTRIVAGVGVPQLTAIAQCAEVAHKKGATVIADGGIRYSGDISKAIAAGADAVMIGSLFAGVDEAPGELVLYQGRSYKVYRGMGSLSAMQCGSADRYGQGGVKELSKFVPEGIEGRVPYKGKLEQVLFQLAGGLRAGMGYTGCTTIHELQTKAEFVRMSSAGYSESHVHDVIITKEAPNYNREGV